MVCELYLIKLLFFQFDVKIVLFLRNMILNINYKMFIEWLWVNLYFVNKVMLKM